MNMVKTGLIIAVVLAAAGIIYKNAKPARPQGISEKEAVNMGKKARDKMRRQTIYLS